MHPLRMGLEPLAFERWLEQRADDNKLLEERGRLIAVHPYDVIAALPKAHDAVAELAEVINRRGGAIAGGEVTWNVLESMGKSIAKDIYVLTAEGGVLPPDCRCIVLSQTVGVWQTRSGERSRKFTSKCPATPPACPARWTAS